MNCHLSNECQPAIIHPAHSAVNRGIHSRDDNSSSAVTINQMRIFYLCPLWLTSLLFGQELPKEPLANITQLTTGFSALAKVIFLRT